jgi:hypothetical protein
MARVNSLITAFAKMGDAARLEGRPLPVIATDVFSARILIEAVAGDLGCPVGSLMRSEKGSPVFGMYDGIKIIALPAEACKHEVDGWREHFGPLAEIWSA